MVNQPMPYGTRRINVALQELPNILRRINLLTNIIILLPTPTDFVLSKVKHASSSSISVDRRITGNV